MGRRISKEFLHPSILEGVNNKIGNLDSLETDAKGNMVQAINELSDKIDTEIAEGKELIANAVGEPLTTEESFDEMSTDINSLLSTFKTNMMNNGITVESSDRFKSLIDKIATMVEEGEGKGMKVVSGNFTYTKTADSPTIMYNTATNDSCFYHTLELGFNPTLCVMHSKNNSGYKITSLYYDGRFESTYSSGTAGFICVNTGTFCGLTVNNNITMPIVDALDDYSYNFDWIAVGVGEEDTTLRDSLASILTEEGVSVTEEDDMASLITKVDEEFTKDNEAISEMETDAENTRSTLAGLMTEGGYNITGDEDITSLLDLLVLSGIIVTDIKQIACGNSHTFILKNDGSIWSCGFNSNGELGLGDSDNNAHSTFTQVTKNINNDVKQIAACGNDHTFIIKNDDSVWGCGSNRYGELGLGNTTNKSSFTQVTTNINNDVKQVACGYNYT